MSKMYLLAALALALFLGFGGVAVAQSADSASASSDAPGGEGFTIVNDGRRMAGNVALTGWSYNDGSR